MQIGTASGMDDNAAVTQKQLTTQLTAMKDEILSAIRQMIAELRIEFRNELKTGLDGLRNEFSRDIRQLRGEVKQDIQQLGDDLTEQMRQIETNMLTSFHSYGKGISHRMHDLEGSDVDIKGRLAALEDRMLNLETRRH